MSAVAAAAGRDLRVCYRRTETLNATQLEAARTLLSPAEREKSGTFHRSDDRRDYAVAHALLRSSLSRLVDVPADTWTFTSGTSGKPELSVVSGSHANITFNLSHTRGLVACVIASGMRVGIDVLRTQPAFDYGDVASRYFSQDELTQLSALREADRLTRFMELWALKEAFTKAIGQGLSDAISNFRFLIEGQRIRFAPPPSITPACWQFALFIPAPYFRIAVAIERPTAQPWTMRASCFDTSSEARLTKSG
jgi:4'-phosphopantetheinyl transferase